MSMVNTVNFFNNQSMYNNQSVSHYNRTQESSILAWGLESVDQV